MTFLKVCGITCEEDARLCVALGVDAIGINLIPASPRYVDISLAQSLVRAVGNEIAIVAIVANKDVATINAMRLETHINSWQLHGDEPPEVVQSLHPYAYKAVRIGTPMDVNQLRAYPGDTILADAKVNGALGGSGVVFDWRLVQAVAQERRLILAGGLHPENVQIAITTVRPFGVDVASGVERAGAPRRKDSQKLRAFVNAVRSG